MKSETVQSIETKFTQLQPFLSERARRLWAATEAKQLGWGGVSLVEQATGISSKTIRKESPNWTIQHSIHLRQADRESPAAVEKMYKVDPHLPEQLEALIEPVRGDPESPLRWTCKSIRRLASELTKQGHPIGISSIRFLLHKLEYSLQGNRKTREGEDHPDRNEQFLCISNSVKRFLHSDQPVISVDTKKKENLGNFSNKGREWCPQGKPLETNMHDFPDKELVKAIPYGVYDIGRNEGWVNIGINRDTAPFAANRIRRWWELMGQKRFSKAIRLLITADATEPRPFVSFTTPLNFCTESFYGTRRLAVRGRRTERDGFSGIWNVFSARATLLHWCSARKTIEPWPNPFYEPTRRRPLFPFTTNRNFCAKPLSPLSDRSIGS